MMVSSSTFQAWERLALSALGWNLASVTARDYLLPLARRAARRLPKPSPLVRGGDNEEELLADAELVSEVSEREIADKEGHLTIEMMTWAGLANDG